jgi:hypothetical protein
MNKEILTDHERKELLAEKSELWYVINKVNRRCLFLEQRCDALEKQLYEVTHKKVEVVQY